MSRNGNISVSTELEHAISLHLDELTKSLDKYFPNRESYPNMSKTAVHI